MKYKKKLSHLVPNLVPLTGDARDVLLGPNLLCHQLLDSVQVLLSVLVIYLVLSHIGGELVQEVHLLPLHCLSQTC